MSTLNQLAWPNDSLASQGSPLDLLASRPAGVAAEPVMASHLPSVHLARLHGFDVDERPLLSGLSSNPGELVCARSAVPLRLADRGRTVVLAFESGQPARPIIMGVLQEGLAPEEATPGPALSARVDDERVVITAEKEVCLRCGDASITLTRAGKVLINGHYVLSRSSGYNKIKGAAVDIN